MARFVFKFIIYTLYKTKFKHTNPEPSLPKAISRAKILGTYKKNFENNRKSNIKQKRLKQRRTTEKKEKIHQKNIVIFTTQPVFMNFSQIVYLAKANFKQT